MDVSKFASVMLWFFAIVLFLLIGYIVTDSVFESSAGSKYTDGNWLLAEQYYCATQNMVAQEYVGQSCSLFGCVDVEKTRCIGNGNEKLIDYDNPIFCQYTMKGDYGWCD
jgi:hypothetical protein